MVSSFLKRNGIPSRPILPTSNTDKWTPYITSHIFFSLITSYPIYNYITCPLLLKKPKNWKQKFSIMKIRATLVKHITTLVPSSSKSKLSLAFHFFSSVLIPYFVFILSISSFFLSISILLNALLDCKKINTIKNKIISSEK